MIDLQQEISLSPADSRLAVLHRFLTAQLPGQHFTITPLAGDASFRRYFRVHLPDGTTYVAMDAPPDKEDCAPFIAVAACFRQHQLAVPAIIAQDVSHGLLLLSDLGDNLYYYAFTATNADQLYRQAIDNLIIIQSCQQGAPYIFPDFAPLLQQELLWFREWYLLRHLKASLSEADETLLRETFTLLLHSAAEQPQYCVHRDYHSRNLMWLPTQQTGILDFQDAVWGPVTYDLVSLLRDCYISWPEARVSAWADYYYQQAVARGLLSGTTTAASFTRWLDWMGVQRHLKALFIFARKFYRDGNGNYLGDIPRTIQYVFEVTERYPELQEFRTFLLKCHRS